MPSLRFASEEDATRLSRTGQRMRDIIHKYKNKELDRTDATCSLTVEYIFSQVYDFYTVEMVRNAVERALPPLPETEG